jgi:uncharacterized protein YdcH (DUF465 family)
MIEVKITHRATHKAPSKIHRSDRPGEATSLEEELPKMELQQEELKAHLIATNDEYRRLAAEHSNYARKLDELESLPHLSAEEEMEEHRLKKIKLLLKDQMEEIVSRSRARQVA